MAKPGYGTGHEGPARSDLGKQAQRNRRPRGTGTIVEKHGAYYGQWRVRGTPIFRKLGPVRKPGTREGLTKTQAEAKLRELISETAKAPQLVAERMSIDQVGRRLITHLKAKGRKESTLSNYESHLRVHLSPHFGQMPITEITSDDVEDFIERCLAEDGGQSIKSTRNYLGLLHSIFEFAIRKRWAHENPCKLVEKPDPEEDNKDIRFLDQAELDALLEAASVRSRHRRDTLERAARVRQLRDSEGRRWKAIAAEIGVAESTAIYLYRCEPDAVSESEAALCRVERALYVTAAMSGLRQGELLALRWMDIDWVAQRIRVRRNYVRGRFGTPKSRRSSRAVPLADRVAGELERLFRASAYQSDDDLVFCHPHTGNPLDRSQVLKRFKQALNRAGVREARFHDLRHTFGTRMAAAGVPMRTLQEWMGHRDYKTTLIYADYAPAPNEVDLVNAGFASPGHQTVIKLSESGANSEQQNPHEMGISD